MRTKAPVAASVVAFMLSGCSSPSTPSSPAPAGALQTIAEAQVSDAIVDVTAGSVDTDNYAGQSVTVPAGSYSSIRFNWYNRTKQLSAFSKLYVLTQEYLGLPHNLPNAPGLVASSTAIENDEYLFSQSVTLTGPRTYWFYTDGRGHYAGSFDIDVYSGGVMYVTGIATQPFRIVQASGRMTSTGFVPAPPGVTIDANFRLRGVKQ